MFGKLPIAMWCRMKRRNDAPLSLAGVATDRDGATSPLIAYADVAPFPIVPPGTIGTT
jgi:hypothetical protein